MSPSRHSQLGSRKPNPPRHKCLGLAGGRAVAGSNPVSPTENRRFNSCDWSTNRRSRANLDRTGTVKEAVGSRDRPYALPAMLRIRLLGGLEVDAGVAGGGRPGGETGTAVARLARRLSGRACACRRGGPVVAGRARLERSGEPAHGTQRAARGARSRGRASAGDARDGGAWRPGPVGRPARVLGADRRGSARGGSRALPRRGAGGSRRGVGVRAALATRRRASGGGDRAGTRCEGGGRCRLGAGVGPPTGRVGSAGRGG